MEPIKTAAIDPLRIDEVGIPGIEGTIGITGCPGRRRSWSIAGPIARDLDSDLKAISGWGAEILLSLIEEHEYFQAGVADMDERMPKGLLHIKMPIPDASIPNAAWEHYWSSVGKRIRAALERGGKICVHCMGGLGRSGMIAARLLVEFGVEPGTAIRQVRVARPGAIETREQEAYIRRQHPL